MAGVGIELSEAAFADLQDAVDFLWERSPDNARAFAEAYRSAVLNIRDFPLSGSTIGEGERRWLISGTQYQLVYRLEGAVATIIAIAHTSRRPGYWRERL